MACAMACALVFLAAAFVCVTAEESEAGTDDTYTVGMRVGDTFSYSPETNLVTDDNGTVAITISGSAATTSYTGGTANGFLTWNGTTVSGTPETAGDYTLVITATWTSAYNSSVTQSATQTLSFTVFDKVVVKNSSGTSAESETVVYTTGTDVSYDLAYSGSSDGTYEISSSITYPDDVSSGLSVSSDGSVSGTPKTAGQYQIDFTVKFTSTKEYQVSPGTNGTAVTSSDTFTLYIVVTDSGFAISSDLKDSTFVGASWTYEASTTEVTGGSVAWEITSVTLGSSTTNLVSSTSTSGNTITYTLSNGQTLDLNTSSGVITGKITAVAGDTHDQYNIHLLAKQTVGTYTTDASATLYLYVYTTISYGSDPTATVTVSSNSTASVSVTVSDTNATAIVIDWGDGSSETFTASTETTIEDLTDGYSHSYTEEGTYTVSVVASNDGGDVVASFLYTTTAVFPTVSITAVEQGATPYYVTLYFTISDADELSVDWGDGEVATYVDADAIDGLAAGTTHQYDYYGVYTIVLTASNSDGERTSQTTYTTASAAETIEEAAGDWSLVIVLAVLAIAFALIGYFRHPYAYIAALILVIAIVVCIATGCTGFGDL